MSKTNDHWAGGCLCGAVRYAVSTPPIAQSLCFCTVCQTIAGGSPSGLLAAARESFHFQQGEEDLEQYALTSDAGNPIIRSFCRVCGTHMISDLPLKTDRIFVKAGTLDERAAFIPTAAIFTGRAQPWHRPLFNNAIATFEQGVVAQEKS